MLAYLNGEIVPEDEAKVSITDRGWLYGDGVFETLRTYNHRVFKISEHLARLERSAALIGIELPFSARDMDSIVHKLLKQESADRDLAIRITVSRGAGGIGLWPAEPIEPTVAVQLRELPDYPKAVFEEGWKMVTAKTRRNSPQSIDPQIKSANFLNNILAKREAVSAGVNEALMLNNEGFVAESTVSNVFIVENKTLITPPVSAGILPGITREMFLEIAARSEYEVEERLFTLETVYAADEMFITLTSAGLIPIVELDQNPIGDGRPGPVVGKLRELYKDYISAFFQGENNG